MATTDDDFRAAVTLYIELADEIERTAKEMREVKKRKDALGDTILERMRKQDIDECQLGGGGKLVRKSTKRVESLKKDHILKELCAALGGDEQRAESVLNNINSQRTVDMKESLQRTK